MNRGVNKKGSKYKWHVGLLLVNYTVTNPMRARKACVLIRLAADIIHTTFDSVMA